MYTVSIEKIRGNPGPDIDYKLGMEIIVKLDFHQYRFVGIFYYAGKIETPIIQPYNYSQLPIFATDTKSGVKNILIQ